MLLAINEGLVIGQVMAVVHRHPDKTTELYIDDLAVSERFQRRNIATQMVRKLFAMGIERGCEEVWVATELNNTSAKKIYGSLGLSASAAYIFDANALGKPQAGGYS
ncbi:MAG: GNAT family N-acetyltransferase [Gammaproteobacteria bacterium]|nr:GNAT family N-acetyltransferase [Gammaproteobacteria bacterium]MCF6363203.1 GNAT family N-acetyltransferase [Gammaproteobacteria bacterium]